MVEILGIVASILIAISMLAKADTLRSKLFMRILNCFGSLAFVVYGLILPAYATAFLNLILVVINIYYIIQFIKEYKRKK